ncbi:PREDICTED: uncharacterized protein C19orf52-like [Priapulus caudatus]|uniref:Uncharacterized protein C19orf52-like n=1 Tax=Priapulus caudatus TaxID=37621 RepID=A0ABM1E723_PRICU|nr:PREDICTED: uncharacterized protein C19orf52-like [Priapulus caudatus]
MVAMLCAFFVLDVQVLMQNVSFSLAVNYCKVIGEDYASVGRDVIVDSKAQPIKAAFYFSAIGLGVYAIRTNPTRHDFRISLLTSVNDNGLVSDNARNPQAATHVRQLVSCENEGLIRHVDLGLMSLMWVDNYDEACKLYEARCPSLKPRWLTFNTRIVDIGCFGHWFLMERAMKEYDVNPDEFPDKD